jgi:hypothetical protein
MFRRIIRLVVIGWVTSMVVGMITALKVRQQVGPTTDGSADEFMASAIFGPLAYQSTARQLRAGTLECWYGGGALDLRDAVLAPEGATIRVRAVFGGGQILVPAEWRVVSKIRGMGGLSDARGAKGFAENAPTLTIEGMVFAGGFAVMSELDENSAEWLQKMEARQHHEPASSTGIESPSAPPALEPEPEMTPAPTT